MAKSERGKKSNTRNTNSDLVKSISQNSATRIENVDQSQDQEDANSALARIAKKQKLYEEIYYGNTSQKELDSTFGQGAAEKKDFPEHYIILPNPDQAQKMK